MESEMKQFYYLMIGILDLKILSVSKTQNALFDVVAWKKAIFSPICTLSPRNNP